MSGAILRPDRSALRSRAQLHPAQRQTGSKGYSQVLGEQRRAVGNLQRGRRKMRRSSAGEKGLGPEDIPTGYPTCAYDM